MNNDNIDDIYTAAHQTVEHYLDTFQQNKIFPKYIEQLGERIRHELFPLVVQHLIADVNTPFEVHKAHVQYLAGVAMEYINVMEQTMAKSIANASLKDRLTARRGADEADTITIETSEKGGMTR